MNFAVTKISSILFPIFMPVQRDGAQLLAKIVVMSGNSQENQSFRKFPPKNHEKFILFEPARSRLHLHCWLTIWPQSSDRLRTHNTWKCRPQRHCRYWLILLTKATAFQKILTPSLLCGLSSLGNTQPSREPSKFQGVESALTWFEFDPGRLTL